MVVVHGTSSHICCATQEKIQRPVALSTQDCTVPGLTLIKDFVSEEEEQVLVSIARKCSSSAKV